MSAAEANGSTSGKGPRFVPFPCAVLDALARRQLSADALAVLGWLFLQAKISGDTGVVFTSSSHVASNLPGLSKDVAKRTLQALDRQGLVRRLRREGTRGRHAFVLHLYVYFDAAREMHVVNAAATTDADNPATSVCTSTRTRSAPRRAPPRIEPDPEPDVDEHPSDALRVSGAGVRARSLSVLTSEAEIIADAWSIECRDLAQPARPLANGVRRKLAAAAKREKSRDWTATFRRVAASAFLTGQRTSFRAALLWVVAPDNLAKIDSGQYEDGPRTARLDHRDAARQDAAAGALALLNAADHAVDGGVS